MARPSKWTDEREQLVLEALRAGMSRRGAADYAGISVDTVERRMRRFAGFAASVKQAEASVELRAVRTITEAWTAGEWRAAGLWLERRRPVEWGRRVTLDLADEIRDLVRSAGLDDAVADEAIAEAQEILKRARHA